jgi:MFS family permease
MPPDPSRSTLRQVLALGVTQTIAWAGSWYLPAILAQPIAAELGLSVSTVFGALSVSLIVMAVAGPPVGRAIDRRGGRGVLALANLVLAAGLVFLGLATNATAVFAAWCVLGVGMAMGLYDVAFATLVRLHGAAARNPITGVTLIAGFASTVGWPFTALVAEQFGWREACFAWAALNVLVAMPLNLLCIPSVSRGAHEHDRAAPAGGAADEKAKPAWSLPGQRRAFVLLAFFSAATAFVTSAMAAHLPGLLLAAGATTIAALTAAALLGPAQVAARLTEFLAAHRFRFHPLLTARIATALHPAGALVLGTFGGAPLAASGFAVLHGAGNGMITIAKGTLPLAIFGAAGYGLLQGLLGVLSRAMQALAPYAFGLVLEGFGVRAAIGLSAALSLAALAALFGLRAKPAEAPKHT